MVRSVLESHLPEPEAQAHPELADTFGISRTADGHLCAIVGAGVDFSEFTTEGAMAALDEYDIPCAPALPRAAVPDDPQVQASESWCRTSTWWRAPCASPGPRCAMGRRCVWRPRRFWALIRKKYSLKRG